METESTGLEWELRFLHYINKLPGDADVLWHKLHLISKVLGHGSQKGTQQNHCRAGKSGLLGPAPTDETSVYPG